MVVTYYVKLFCTGTDRHNCIVSSPSSPRDNNMKYSETEPDNETQSNTNTKIQYSNVNTTMPRHQDTKIN